MPMHLITGHAETAHISAADAGALNAAALGPGSYVFDYGDGLSATMTTANKVTIGTGALMHQGRQALVDAPVELTVESGTQAQKRIDLVVARYTKSGNIDEMQLAVVKGTPVSYGEPSAPEIEEGSILEGATASDMPLWSIEIDGITPGDPVQLFETVPSLDALRDSVSQTQLYSDDNWLVMRFGPFMYARCHHVATAGSGSWESTKCPFSIPEGLRPTTETMAPVCTENGGSTTGVIKADASGGLMVQNMGSTTSAEVRSGVLVWIPGK